MLAFTFPTRTAKRSEQNHLIYFTQIKFVKRVVFKSFFNVVNSTDQIFDSVSPSVVTPIDMYWLDLINYLLV